MSVGSNEEGIRPRLSSYSQMEIDTAASNLMLLRDSKCNDSIPDLGPKKPCHNHIQQHSNSQSPPQSPNTQQTNNTHAKKGNALNSVQYDGHQNGNCTVYIERDPISVDFREDFNQMYRRQPPERSWKRVILNSDKAVNKLLDDPMIKSKGLIALIPAVFFLCQGIINKVAVWRMLMC